VARPQSFYARIHQSFLRSGFSAGGPWGLVAPSFVELPFWDFWRFDFARNAACMALMVLIMIFAPHPLPTRTCRGSDAVRHRGTCRQRGPDLL